MGQVLEAKIKTNPAAIEKLHSKIHIKKHYFLNPRRDSYIYHLKEPFELSPYRLRDSVISVKVFLF